MFGKSSTYYTVRIIYSQTVLLTTIIEQNFLSSLIVQNFSLLFLYIAKSSMLMLYEIVVSLKIAGLK